jgi:hypothetical protein
LAQAPASGRAIRRPRPATVHGTRLHGELPPGVAVQLPTAVGRALGPATSATVTFAEVDRLAELAAPVWESKAKDLAWPGRFAVAPVRGGVALSVTAEGQGIVRLQRRSIRVEWLAGTAGAAHSFLAFALPLWLELRGVPVLHASAVAREGRAVALVAASGSGKSTLAAELTRTGWELLADDGLAVRRAPDGRWRCFHGPATLRLWPSALRDRLGLAPDDLARVHAGVEKRLLPVPRKSVVPAGGVELSCVYLVTRRQGTEGPATVQPCSAREALARLVAHSLAGGPTAALGLAASRLERFAVLAESVPVRSLELPSGPATAQLAAEVLAAGIGRPSQPGGRHLPG